MKKRVRQRLFPGLLCLCLLGCGSTSVTFVNATPEQVAYALTAEGGTGTEHSLLWTTHKRIWPADFRRTILEGETTADWSLGHFLRYQVGRDTVRVKPETGYLSAVTIRSGIKEYVFLDLMPKLWYSRNADRERLIIVRAYWRLLERDASVWADGGNGWRPPRPPVPVHRDGWWIALRGASAAGVVDVLESAGFMMSKRSGDRRILVRRRGNIDHPGQSSIGTIEKAVVWRTGDTVVVGLRSMGWREKVFRLGFFPVLYYTTPLPGDYERRVLDAVGERLAIRFDALLFVDPQEFIEPAALEWTPGEGASWDDSPLTPDLAERSHGQ